MKIETKYYLDEDDYRDFFSMSIDGKEVFSAGGGEPEDNCIGRDLGFVYGISDWIEMAHKAGLAGEVFEYSHTDCKTSEEFWGEE